jgi:ABC-type phosphate transport system permease subunit
VTGWERERSSISHSSSSDELIEIVISSMGLSLFFLFFFEWRVLLSRSLAHSRAEHLQHTHTQKNWTNVNNNPVRSFLVFVFSSFLNFVVVVPSRRWREWRTLKRSKILSNMSPS